MDRMKDVPKKHESAFMIPEGDRHKGLILAIIALEKRVNALIDCVSFLTKHHELEWRMPPHQNEGTTPYETIGGE